MAFGIILKYYSQGLKPLGSTLSLSFQPSSPQSLTQALWKLSPPSLIHHGQSTHSGVYIFINVLHDYIYKSRLPALTLRLSSLITHKPTNLYKLVSLAYKTFLQLIL